MITALLGIVIAQLVGITGAKLWTRRSQRKTELQRWAPFRQNPLIDPLLRKYTGEIQDKRKQWAANRIKATLRNFVNSEAFSISVDGAMNTDSSFWTLLQKFRKQTKLGALEPADESACTIQ